MVVCGEVGTVEKGYGHKVWKFMGGLVFQQCSRALWVLSLEEHKERVGEVLVVVLVLR